MKNLAGNVRRDTGMEKEDMDLSRIFKHTPPEPWEGVGKIPWNEPGFSRRMLQNHLAQDHDQASRRNSIIERHVRWIAERFSRKNARILDFGCGPGFYTHALTGRGFKCTGVDFSPASIEYAKNRASESGLEIEYVLADIRDYVPDGGFDCFMMCFGEFNVFKAADADAILRKAASSLKPGGLAIIEAHTFEAVKLCGQSPDTWDAFERGLFADCPHICLQENFWDENLAVASTLYFVIETATANLTEYDSSMKAYTESEYREMFREAGFSRPEILSPELWPSGLEYEGKFMTFVAEKSLY